jgi:hypothetical protein
MIGRQRCLSRKRHVAATGPMAWRFVGLRPWIGCKLFIINMLYQNASLWEINILLRPWMNCKLFVINILTFSAKMSFSRRSALCVLGPTGC